MPENLSKLIAFLCSIVRVCFVKSPFKMSANLFSATRRKGARMEAQGIREKKGEALIARRKKRRRRGKLMAPRRRRPPPPPKRSRRREEESLIWRREKRSNSKKNKRRK